MQPPFVLEFEPPTRADLARLLDRRAARRRWALAALVLASALLVGGWWAARRAGAGGAGPGAREPVDLGVSSRPPGARVTVDGHEQGRTPTSLLVPPGPHELALLAPQAVEARYHLQVDAPGRFEATLWRRQPLLTRLHPALPGAMLASVDTLHDGRLALGVAIPPNGEVQAWLLEPVGGAMQRLPLAPAAGRLAIAPDGARVAALARSSQAADLAAEVRLWPTGVAESPPTVVWRAPDRGARVLDLAWSPDGQRLLIGTTEEVRGAQRSQVWVVQPAAAAVEPPPEPVQPLVGLPSTLVPGSVVWSLDGARVAFLTRIGGRRALCLLDVTDGAFRYLADLDAADTSAARLPFPPVAWSSEGHRLLFVAGAQEPPSGPFGWLERPRRLVYRVDEDLVPRPIGPTDADVAAWREDGTSLALLGRLKDDGPLVLRSADAGLGLVNLLAELPLRAPAYAARWDLPRGRLLLASPSASATDALDYTLVRLGLESWEEE